MTRHATPSVSRGRAPTAGPASSSPSSRSPSWSACSPRPRSRPGAVQGDELVRRAGPADGPSSAKIANQKAPDRAAQQLAGDRSQGAIAQTKDQLTASPTTSRPPAAGSRTSSANINEVKATYQDARQPARATSTSSSQRIEAQEAAKKVGAAGPARPSSPSAIREAYEAERTSMLETFLSGASFTDMLAEMSYPARRRRAGPGARRADRGGPRDAARAAPDRRRDPRARRTCCARRPRSRSRSWTSGSRSCAKAQAQLRRSRRPAKAALAAQKRAPVREDGRRRGEAAAGARRGGGGASTRLAEEDQPTWSPRQFNQGNIPSQYNGTLRWPMGGTVTQPFGCTGVVCEPPQGQLRPLAQRHRHRGPVRHRGPRVGRPGGSSTSAGTTPTAPTRPGS